MLEGYEEKQGVRCASLGSKLRISISLSPLRFMWRSSSLSWANLYYYFNYNYSLLSSPINATRGFQLRVAFWFHQSKSIPIGK